MTVPSVMNRFVAPFFMGLFMAACAASASPIASVILLAASAIAGYFSLPNSDQVIERLFDRMV